MDGAGVCGGDDGRVHGWLQHVHLLAIALYNAKLQPTEQIQRLREKASAHAPTYSWPKDGKWSALTVELNRALAAAQSVWPHATVSSVLLLLF